MLIQDMFVPPKQLMRSENGAGGGGGVKMKIEPPKDLYPLESGMSSCDSSSSPVRLTSTRETVSSSTDHSNGDSKVGTNGVTENNNLGAGTRDTAFEEQRF